MITNRKERPWPTSLNLPEELIESYEKEAQRQDRSRAYLMRTALEEWIQKNGKRSVKQREEGSSSSR